MYLADARSSLPSPAGAGYFAGFVNLPSPLTGEQPPALRALLGPTNTGKTHRAIERMLEHESAMIGLPLRLLAREVYDRISARVGEGAAALVTGEEKRIPARPRYWVCTVEAMPVTVAVDFLAVDEVQLATHRHRGHVFTDRLLHARGARETWFLGSATIGPLLERLCPSAVVERRPRFSTLSDAGSLALSALPPRSVVVAFSATRVYELAERIRGKRGGAAVVIGALSPRTRNAQVALFQSGEVDTLVATDAIGMGLNLDVDNVVFADLHKFDGRESRRLEDAELAQIAGRAGRHMREGRFATLEPLGPLPPPTVRALERHRFPPDERVFWRNHELDLDSLAGLLASLRRRPERPWLRLADDVEDLKAATALARMPEVTRLAGGPDRVRLLWEVCQIPDFRQRPFDDHFPLLAATFQQLCRPARRLGRPWIEAHLRRLESPEADLETLLDRMSAVRTWTYITSHREWVDDAPGWQARTHDLEDRLSDALHRQLLERFVDAPGKRGRRPSPKNIVRSGGLRSLAGELAAKIPDARAGTIEDEAGGPGSGPGPAADAWVTPLIDAPHEGFRVLGDGRIFAGEQALGRLVRGADRLHPEVAVTATLGAGARLQLGRRLRAFARDLVAELVAPLQLREAPQLGPAARGLLYQLERSLGSVSAASTREQVRDLTRGERRLLGSHGIVVGRLAVFAPPLLAPRALIERSALCAAELWPQRLPLPGPSADVATLCLPVVPEIQARLYQALGYLPMGGLCVRADELERIGRDLLRGCPFPVIASGLQLSPAEAGKFAAAVKAALGLRHRAAGRVPRRTY
jgi:ATP-dependent RNA helicase SUPV3L1/SUV3